MTKNIKKLTVLLFVTVAMSHGLSLRAQTLIDNYRFATRVDETAWIDITGVDSALVTPPASGRITSGGFGSLLTNIGFTFPFAGTDYTTFGTNLMGAVRLGARIMGTQSGTSILSTAATLPKIDGLGLRGMADTSCYIRCAIIGTAGNRVLVVEHRLAIYQHTNTFVSWQTQLYEATGEVWLVYGPSEGISELPTTQPGLAKSNTDMLFLDFANHSVQRFASTPVPVNAAGVWPEEGRCYIFTPDSAACPAPPTVTALSSDPDSTMLSLSAGGLVYRLCIPAMGLDTLVSDTLLLFSGINPTTVYNGTIQTVCGVGDSSFRVRPFSFTTTGCGTVHLLPWADDFQLAASDNCWQKAYSNYSLRWQRQTASNNSYMRTGYSSSSSAIYNEWLITPPVELPDVEGITMSWDYKCEQSNGAPKVRVRLLVCDTTDAVDTTADWVTLTTIEDYEQNFQRHQLLLDAYAGHRVRVAFQRFGRGGAYAYIDNVGIEVITAPSVAIQVPGNVDAGDTVEMVAVSTAGVLSNPQWQWTSAMETRGEAVIVSAADTLKIVYLTTGMDTVSVTITSDYGTTTATAVIDVVDCRPVTVFPWYEGFEHDLGCWESTAEYCSWSIIDTYTHNGAYCLRSNTNSCPTALRTSLIVSQPVVVPTDVYMLRLGFWAILRGPSVTSIYRNVNILVADANCSDWSTATVLGTANANANYRYFEFPLDAYAGQTVRIGLQFYDLNYYAIVDDIAIRYTREPVGSIATSATQVYGDDTLTATVTLTEGDTMGLSYQWESTMANLGMANIIGSGPQVNITYSGVGVDTIIVTISNTYGSFTDTVHVRVCPVQDTLPWVVDFSNDFSCWQVLNGTCEVNSNGYLSFNDWPTAVASPAVYVPTDGNVELVFDCAYSFFYGNTQVMVTTDMITFDTLGVFPFVDGTHPSTLIPLSAYAGQRIRLIFKATGEFLRYYLFNVNIRYALDPVVSLTVDDDYFPNTPMTLTANLVEGDTTGIAYIFTSSKAQRGEASLVQDGSAQATLTCYTGDPDTVTVVATNGYGSDTAWTVVNVKPCDTVDALSWIENFDNYYTCWWQPEGSIWDLPIDGSTMAAAINVWQSTDSWLVSRAISLPNLPVDGNDELLLCWDAAAMYAYEHSYCVMITTEPDYRDLSTYDTLISLDTVYPDIHSGMSAIQAPLSTYAGQNIHLAFRYTTEYYEPDGLPGVLLIDNVRIIDTLLVPPTPPEPDTVWRTVTVTVNVAGACEPYGSGSYVDSSSVEIGYNMLDTATIGGHWQFVGWSDNGTGNPRSIFVTSDTAIAVLFEWVADSTQSIDNILSSDIKVYSLNGRIMVEGADGEEVRIYDMMGREMINCEERNFRFHTGIYLVRIGTRPARKVVVIK